MAGNETERPRVFGLSPLSRDLGGEAPGESRPTWPLAEKQGRVPGWRLEPSAGRGNRMVASGVALFLLVFLLLLDVPETADVVQPFQTGVLRAQEIVDAMRGELAIPEGVHVVPVTYHPFVLAVEREQSSPSDFVLSFEIGFLLGLEESELRAALAHELGHVWIFTHHPYLQTERLANEIGERVAPRADLERLYRKLWAYEGTPGVDLDTLLGPAPAPRPTATGSVGRR